MLKTCNKCKEEFELKLGFHRSPKTKDGYKTICKNCSLIRKRKYLHIKDEKVLCLKCKEYKEPDKFDLNYEKYFRRYSDGRCKSCKIIEYEKRKIGNRDKNPFNTLIRERFSGVRDRAKKNNLELDIDKEYLKELWEKQKGLCAISKIKMTCEIFNGRVNTNLSVDRIDSSKGYVKDNVQLVCMAVNQMKNDLTKEQLIYFCKQIIDNHEYTY